MYAKTAIFVAFSALCAIMLVFPIVAKFIALLIGTLAVIVVATFVIVGLIS